jgi:hypothetical protein
MYSTIEYSKLNSINPNKANTIEFMNKNNSESLSSDTETFSDSENTNLQENLGFIRKIARRITRRRYRRRRYRRRRYRRRRYRRRRYRRRRYRRRRYRRRRYRRRRYRRRRRRRRRRSRSRTYNTRYKKYRYKGKRYGKVTVSRNYGKNYRYNGNKYKKNKRLIKIKNRPIQNYSYSRDRKSSNKLSNKANSLFKKDIDLTKTKIDRDYSLKTSKTRVKKSFYVGAALAIAAIIILISLKLIFRKK